MEVIKPTANIGTGIASASTIRRVVEVGIEERRVSATILELEQ